MEKAKILIVDDEQVVLSFTSDALSTMGHAISATSSQEQALEWVEKEKYDFLLTDIKMPEMDGITLARKALELDPDLGVLFMTGYADLETAKKAIAAGAYDYIMKPFELQEIRQSVSVALVNRRERMASVGVKGLSKLSELSGALTTVSDGQTLLKLILGFALLQFDLPQGSVFVYDRRRKVIRFLTGRRRQPSAFFESELTDVDPIPGEYMNAGDIRIATSIGNHPLFDYLLHHQEYAPLHEALRDQTGFLISLSIPENESLHLILTLNSEEVFSINEADRKLLAVMLNLSSVSLENLTLLEDVRRTMAKLENLQDHLIGLERAATQGLMSSEIAHELNNFLTIVSSNIELFEMKVGKGIPETAGKHLETVKRNLEKIERFTSALSDSGKMASHRQICNLNEMVEEIVTLVTHQKKFRRIKIETQLDSRLPSLQLDSSQMQQLLYNMLNNAAEAIGNERDDGRIEIMTSLAADKLSFELEIKDNGGGLNTEDLQRAFKDRFTTKERGHGFGLMVCKRIINNHGGTVKADSSTGAGAIFHITLPVS